MGRQKQERKSRATRERLISASIETITELGLSAASAKEISRRAGITWGAAQHHFGTKEEILLSILQLSHRGFIEGISEVSLRDGNLKMRVSRFVDFMWGFYQEDLYLATLEIISATRDTDFHGALKPFADEHLDQLRTIFFEPDISESALREALLFAHFCLNGMTMERLLDRGANIRDVTIYLDHCKAVVASIMVSGPLS